MRCLASLSSWPQNAVGRIHGLASSQGGPDGGSGTTAWLSGQGGHARAQSVAACSCRPRHARPDQAGGGGENRPSARRHGLRQGSRVTFALCRMSRGGNEAAEDFRQGRVGGVARPGFRLPLGEWICRIAGVPGLLRLAAASGRGGTGRCLDLEHASSSRPARARPALALGWQSGPWGGAVGLATATVLESRRAGRAHRPSGTDPVHAHARVGADLARRSSRVSQPRDHALKFVP